MKAKKTITGVKAFNKGLKCMNKQYAENTVFEQNGDLSLCKNGIHYCENPLDTLNYYDLCESEFAEVEDLGTPVNGEDKSCTNKILIKGKLDLKAFIEFSFNFLWTKCYSKPKHSSQLAASGNYSKLAASGNSSKLAASGNYSQLASSGDSSQLASSGDSSQLASSGDSSKLAASGDSSKLASSGYSSQLAASGNSSQLAASGDSSQLAASGDSSKLASSGCFSKLAASGINSICAAIGVNSKAKGIIGTWLVLAEYDNGVVKNVKSAKIDGKKLKADTWYVLKDGKFTKSE